MIAWKMIRLPDGSYEGIVSMTPMTAIPGGFTKGKPIKLKAKSKTASGALAKAASVAQTVMNNPILSAALPPGSSTAIKAVSYLATSAAAGKLESAAKKVVGKGAKRLYGALKKLW